MEINNSFDVPLPPKDAWKVLMDIPRVAPCMPGAELTGVVDKDTYNGKVSVKMGPVALAFAGQVKFTEIDETNYRARAKAAGKNSKGRGGANATVDFHLEPAAIGSRVLSEADLTLSGAVAQYGRASGMIQDVAQQLIGQFADTLKAQLDMAAAEEPRPGGEQSAGVAIPDPVPRPLSGFTLLWMLIKSFFRGLSGKK